jgi:hypothetical protein
MMHTPAPALWVESLTIVCTQSGSFNHSQHDGPRHLNSLYWYFGNKILQPLASSGRGNVIMFYVYFELRAEKKASG